jgi:hypothetical protein
VLTAEYIAIALSCGRDGCSCGRKSGKGYITHCPAHHDDKPSLSIAESDGKLLVKCHAGCPQGKVIAGLKERNLWRGSKQRENIGNNQEKVKTKMRKKIVATYDYVDAEGNLLFQVVRYEPKGFTQRRPDGMGGWIWNLEGVSVVPYYLPDIFKATRAYIVEGEEDVKALQRIGLTATTNPGGAGKWREEFSPYFQGKEVVVLPDNDPPGRKHAQDVARKLFGVASWVKVVDLPDLPPKGDPRDWVNAGGTAAELEDLVAAALKWQPMMTVQSVGPYRISDGAICYDKSTKDGTVTVPLCNFTARIVNEMVYDDGAEVHTFFVIEGTHKDGRPLPSVQVPASQFPGLSWVTSAWGNRAVVFAGTSKKDHLRTAIQLLSGEVSRRTVFGHVGWRRIDDGWVYLHGGGGIGSEGPVAGLEVLLEGALRSYTLPLPPQGEFLRQAVRASLDLTRLGPAAVTYPLLSATYRAPLGECAPTDLSLFLAGKTGAQKTALSAIFQGHFGAAFNGHNLPGNWLSTANFLEKLSFLAKDALFTVDDFVPGGSSADIQQLHKKADHLLRGQANQAGRGRMRADGGLRPTFIPRCLILSSGEDAPQGQSLLARMLILEIKRGDVDLELLTKAQDNAARGLYAQAMAGYLQWLAPRIDQLRETLPSRQVELREAARQKGWSHDRTPDMIARLQAGFEIFLQFAMDVEAITSQERTDLADHCWRTLLSVGQNQGGHQESEDSTRRFLALLGATLTSGRAHVADAITKGEPPDPHQWGWRLKTIGGGENAREEWQPQGPCIGWVDGDDLLLEPDAVFAAVQRIAKEQDHPLPWTQRTLWKRLAEKGILASREPSQNRNTVRWFIAGTRRRVLHLKVITLYPKTGPTGPTSPGTHNYEVFPSDRFSEDQEEPVQVFGPALHDEENSPDLDDLWEVTI